MYNNKILVQGLINPSYIPSYLKVFPNSRFEESHKLKLSEAAPNIIRLLAIDVKTNIISAEKIDFHRGCKLNVLGSKNIEIIYFSDDINKKIHKAKYKIPFFTQIPYNNKNLEVKELYTALENLSVTLIDSKNFNINTKIFVAPIFKDSSVYKFLRTPQNKISNKIFHSESTLSNFLFFILIFLLLINISEFLFCRNCCNNCFRCGHSF